MLSSNYQLKELNWGMGTVDCYSLCVILLSLCNESLGYASTLTVTELHEVPFGLQLSINLYYILI